MKPAGMPKQKATGKIRLRKKRLFFILVLFLFIVILFLGIRSLSSFKDLQNDSDWAKALRAAPQNAGTNYLLYGLVEDNETVKIEELFFLNYPADEVSCHILFIPGEALLHRQETANGDNEPLAGEEPREETSEGKITPVYTPGHFYNEGGAELLVKQISYFLGTPVHHFLEINYSGIPALVDYRGGIPYKGDELKGSDYLDYFLHAEEGEEPLERASRRARELGNLVRFIGEKKGLFNTARAVRKAAPYLDTDLSWKELLGFFDVLDPLFDPQSLIIQVPGAWRDFNGDRYFEPDSSQVALLMQNLGEKFLLPRELITVEVLNGSGVTGIAGQVGRMLREEGFQVVKVDNADSFEYQRSQVICRLEDIEPAKEVHSFVPEADLLKEPLADHPAMVTVIIGKDHTQQ